MVGNKSYFQLTQNGELVLFDSAKGVIAWTSNTINSSVASAVLCDNGNLVLLNRKKDVVWQSFDNPSDTLLPGQNLSDHQMLRAASRNSISSFYSLYMDVSGQLKLRWESDVTYWASGSPPQSDLRAILSSEGSFHLLDQRSKSVWSVFGEDHNDSDVKFRFLRLDVDGNLRLFSWLENSMSWRSVWQAVGNQCNVFATCGLCGICIFNASGSPVCKCPFTFTTESNSKCLVPYREGCESGSSMITHEHTFLYGIYPPNDTIVRTSLEQCKSLCQADPLCTAVTFINDRTAECRMKKTIYITGRSDPSLSSISFVKTCFRSNCCFTHAPKVFITIPAWNFKHQIGPRMFKGILSNQRPVAVKDLKVNVEERKFRSEVSKIGSIYHKNLVKLEGYCFESGYKFLVYEFAKNGSLGKCIEDPKMCKRLTWKKRMEICLTVARAISYLHTECREFVSHGNLKCENVVLDENLETKVSEFGLGRVQDEASDTGRAAENDVRDFGKMMMVLISGRQETDFCKWAYEKWVVGEAERVADERIGRMNSDELERALRITFWCLQVD
ncbi:hypothetical protein F0562_015676 [Nyssa sinensis]|uniref:Non-specific serine/threonine protein kinase n=1 Tax=Nyssa sinensis TaxID=561372 RepID=A0A5J4ZL03_9ASTE|nr:hypothetical protein F0562_015676 [Nyssa sinensis]